jgi:hypothetical protein
MGLGRNTLKSISVYGIKPGRGGKNRNWYGSPSLPKLGAEPYPERLRTAAGQERPAAPEMSDI